MTFEPWSGDQPAVSAKIKGEKPLHTITMEEKEGVETSTSASTVNNRSKNLPW